MLKDEKEVNWLKENLNFFKGYNQNHQKKHMETLM